MAAMKGRQTRPTNGQDHERLSPCVCRTLRMVSRAVTQLYDNVLRPSGLRVAQVSILASFAHLGEANLRQLEYMQLNGNQYDERAGAIWHTPRFSGLGHACKIETSPRC